MSDTTFIVCFSVLVFGLFYALFMIANLVEKMRRQKENLDLTRMRVSFLEQLHMQDGGEE